MAAFTTTYGSNNETIPSPIGLTNSSVSSNFYSRTIRFSSTTPLLRSFSFLRRFTNTRSTSEDQQNIISGDETTVNQRRLNTFSGVFTPVCLSMFSALLFLRIGCLIGHAGLLQVILMQILAYIILISTVLSVCAISTNGAIEGGGAYFMISRALGPEFGGSIGTLFFFANIFSSALYITGCIEGLINVIGPGGKFAEILLDGHWDKFLYSFILNSLNLLICLVGSALFAKTSVLIFLVVGICAISVFVSMIFQHPLSIPIPSGNNFATTNMTNFTGFSWDTFLNNIYSNYTIDYTTKKMMDFPSIFAILFSGVTGIMAGANMSGELLQPSKSIPRGTLGAVATTFLVYLYLFFLTAATCSRELLINNYIYMQDIDLVVYFVPIGITMATLSAALSNLIGASRILVALAKDDLFGILLYPIVRFIHNGNPYASVLVSWIIVQAILLIGTLNMIAQITSVFFLLSYFAVNLACLALELASAPNFRPSFKYFSWHTATIGLVGCAMMMFVISQIYSAVAILVCLLLVIVLHVRAPPVHWGSISQALMFHQVRKYLLLLDSRKEHVKYWRPHLLLMLANPRSAVPLISFSNDLKKSGLYVLAHVRVGTEEKITSTPDPVTQEHIHWLNLLDNLKVKAFVEVTMARSVREGLHHLVRLTGLGAMKPNTILFGFYDNLEPVDFFANPSFDKLRQLVVGNEVFLELRPVDQPRSVGPVEYVNMLYDVVYYFRKNLCLARNFHLFSKEAVIKSKGIKHIDVWPTDFFNPDPNQKIDNCWLFLLQLACVINMVSGWSRKTKVRVFMCVNSQTRDAYTLQAEWQEMLQSLRINATISVILCENLSLLTSAAEQGGMLRYDPPESYLRSINSMIKLHCQSTAVLFLTLPAPPLKPEQNVTYLNRLTTLTENLPPTVLVHGITPVTSTTL